jgi:hypothetical protein
VWGLGHRRAQAGPYMAGRSALRARNTLIALRELYRARLTTSICTKGRTSDRGIEARCRERKCHGISLPKLSNARRWSCAGKGELAFRRINPHDLRRSASLDKEFSKGPVTATYVYPSHPRGRGQPVKKDVAGEPTPNSHHPLVASAVVEANVLFCHFWPSPGNRCQPIGLSPETMFLLRLVEATNTVSRENSRLDRLSP